MMEVVHYHLNKATHQEVLAHLQCCDVDFLPPLSSRVNLNDYAHKMMSHAVRVEAWSQGTLVGLLAVYCNDQEKGIAYVTSVSVLKSAMGQGIAINLMTRCKEYAEAFGMQEICLEVASNNLPAINLYKKCGYVLSQTNTATLTMNLPLHDTIQSSVNHVSPSPQPSPAGGRGG